MAVPSKNDLHAVWIAPARKEVHTACNHFVKHYDAKYPKAAEKLTKDHDALLAFYDFSAEHRAHLPPIRLNRPSPPRANYVT